MQLFNRDQTVYMYVILLFAGNVVVIDDNDITADRITPSTSNLHSNSLVMYIQALSTVAKYNLCELRAYAGAFLFHHVKLAKPSSWCQT